MENLVNISRSGYYLQQGDNDTRLVQLSSLAFWRPDDQPMTVTGGVRVLALDTETTGFGVNSTAFGARSRNANANVGVNYDLSLFTRLNAGANVNLTQNNGVQSTGTSQSVGATYTPASIALGSFQYSWSTSAGATNQTGSQNSARQLTLQLAHNLGRSFRLGGGSTVGVQGSQSLSAAASSSTSDSQTAPTKHMIHSGSLSWDLPQESGATQIRLSASDSRALGGTQEFFQLVNFQASNNLQTGQYSSLTGNLTMQGVRNGANTKFVPTSSGAISYQNHRAFGVRGLSFVSDLRLNSPAFLSLLGSAKDQETAAWDNRLDYGFIIGRTQLRFNAQISSSSTKNNTIDPATGGVEVERVYRINKSIMFSAARNFGS